MEDTIRLGSRAVTGAHEFDRNAELLLALAYRALRTQTRLLQPSDDSVHGHPQITEQLNRLQEANQ